MNWYLFVLDIITYYPEELEKTDTTYAPITMSNYRDVRLESDEDSRLYTQLLSMTNWMTSISPLANFPYLRSNIPESPAYGIFL